MYILMISVGFILISISWVYDIYMNIKSGEIALPIKISANDGILKSVAVNRISMKDKIIPVACNHKSWIIENTLVKDIILTVSGSDHIDGLTVFLEKKQIIGTGDSSWKTASSSDGKLHVIKISDHMNKSKTYIPVVKESINYFGDFLLLSVSFPAYHFFLYIFFCVGFSFFLTNKTDAAVFITGFFAVILAIFPMIDVFSSFAFDWGNHLSYMGYTGKYFFENLSFPQTFNSNDSVSYPNPIFYGYLFYPVGGMISAIFKPSESLRIIVFVLFFIQFGVCYELVYKVSKDVKTSVLISVILTFSIYPLTNIYNRSAITEFVSVTSAMICLFYFFIVFVLHDRKISKLMYFFFFYLICAGSHPITFFYFSCILLFLFFFFASDVFKYFDSLKKISYFIVFILIFILILSPWILAFLTFRENLNISSGNLSNPGVYHDIDNPLTRFLPILFPDDPRVDKFGISNVSTPYLDTQANVSILIFLILLLCFAYPNPKEKMKRIEFALKLFFLLVLLSFTSFLSLDNKMFEILPSYFGIIQFCYRLTSYINIFILVVFIFFFTNFEFDRRKKSRIVIFIFVLILCLSSLLIKYGHVYAIKTEFSDNQINYLNDIFGSTDYLTPGLYDPIEKSELKEKEAVFFTMRFDKFGTYKPVDFFAGEDGWYPTNVAAFKWNKIILDGYEIEDSKIRSSNNKLVIRLSEGFHTINSYCSPPLPYRLLRACSLFLYMTIVLSLTIYNLIKAFRGLRRKNVINNTGH
jgi:hypothetical protein